MYGTTWVATYNTTSPSSIVEISQIPSSPSIWFTSFKFGEEVNMEEVPTIGDLRLVYVATRSIFIDEKAKVRRKEKVKNEISSRSHAVLPLIESLGLEKVVQSARLLLGEDIFALQSRAKQRFPELFHSSLEAVTLKEEFEPNAARPLSEVLGDVAKLEDGKHGAAEPANDRATGKGKENAKTEESNGNFFSFLI
jgi:hypothetical protein